MKKCKKCEAVLPLTEFNAHAGRKDGLSSSCRTCQREYSKGYYASNQEVQKKQIMARTKTRRKTNRQRLLEYLSVHPCVDCAATDIRILEFDHLPGEDKHAAVTELVAFSYGWPTIFKEIEKCEVVCANCHRIRTYERSNSYRHIYYNIGV